MRPLAACLLVVSAALLLGGCGSGSSSIGGGSSSTGGGSSSTGSPDPAPGPSAGSSDAPAKKATAPRAPAGSKVVSCENASSLELRASGTDCGAARAAMRRWRRSEGCKLGAGASRASCSLGAYRCQTIAVGRGTAVSCVRPGGGDVSFVARRR